MLFGKLRSPSFVLTALALLATGCPGDNEPLINSFAANPMTVQEGSTTTLTWDVTGADSIKITATPGGEVLTTADGTGSQASGVITENTMFVLEATNDEGTVSRTISVLVQKAGNPTIESFTATPDMVESGGQVVLAWETTNADSVSISPNVVTNGPADGQMTVNVSQTTTFMLTARNATGMATATVVVTVVGPQIQSFTATPQAVTLGDEVTLAWTVLEAAMVTITTDAGDTVYEGTDLTGSTTHVPTVAAPPGTVTYTLIAVDAENRSVAFMVTVNVNPPGGPTAMLTANPSSINLGQTSSLDWVVTNAVGIEILEGATTATTSTELTGSFQVMPLQTTTYTLVARDANDVTAMAMATVTVQAGPPPILVFDAAPNPVALGSPTTLSWGTVSADTVRILNGNTELLVTSANTGTVAVTPTATSTVYTLEVTNSLGMNTSNVTVYAHAAPIINVFTVTPLSFTGGSTVATVTWDVENIATLDLLVNGVPAAGFPVVDVNPMITFDQGTFGIPISASTIFTLIAESAGGVEMQEVTVAQTFMEVEPNDTAGTANPHPGDGSGVIGTIGVVGDDDWYVVMVPPGGNLVAETSDGQGGCAMDTQLFVYGSTNAAPIATNDDIAGTNNRCSRVTPYDNPNVAPDLDLADMAGGVYYLRVIEYAEDNTGPYVLTVTVQNAACGNTLFEGAEQCDDGNTTPGDGCDASCNFEINPNVINPPGGTVTITLAGQGDYELVQVNLTVDGQSITATAADVGGTTCNTVDTALVLADGNFLGIDAAFDGGPTGTAGDCAAFHFPDTVFARNLAAGTYYLLVGNEGVTTGNVQLDVSIINPRCGDTVINTGETCDDGNTVTGDGCAPDCTIEQAPTITLPIAQPLLITGAIDQIGEHEMFQIVVTQTTYLRAETFTPNQAGGCNDDTRLTLRDSTGTELGGDDDSGFGTCSLISPNDPFALLQPGMYTIEVWDYLDNDLIPAYQLEISSAAYTVLGAEVEANDTPATASPLQVVAGVNEVSAAITPAGDLDFYTFTLAAPTEVLIATYTAANAVNTACAGDTQLWLYNAVPTNFDAQTSAAEPALLQYDNDDGYNSCSMITGTDAEPRWIGLPAGTYYVQVREFGSNAEINPYYLRVDLQ